MSLEPFRTILSACVDHADIDLLSEHVTRCGGELARLCPRLVIRVPTAPPPTESDDATQRFLTFEAVADLMSRIAARGRLVLMLDDLQWTEPTALLLLRHLTRSLAAAPVLLVTSRREPGEPASDQLRTALAELERGRVLRLPLPAFDNDEIAALVSDLLPSAPETTRKHIAARVREETAGNPLYAAAVIRHWDEAAGPGGDRTIPPSLREVLWSRVHALGNEAADVLTTASVLGSEFQEDLLIEMVNTSEAHTRRAIDTSVTAGLLVDLSTTRRTLRFSHTLIANALYGEIGVSTRAQLHESAVRVLSKRAGESSPEVVVQLAKHSTLAGMTSEAIYWSTLAGDDALTQLSPTEAAGYYRSALEAAVDLGRPLAEQADLLVRLGEAQHVAGEASALATLQQAANLALTSGNNLALTRSALAADRGFMRTDAGAPEFLAIVEAAVARRRSLRHVDLCALARLTLPEPHLHAPGGTPNRHRRESAGAGRIGGGPCPPGPRRTSRRLGNLGARERTDAKCCCGQGARCGRIFGRPETRVRRACGHLQRGRRVGRRGRGRPQPDPDPRHRSSGGRTATPLDRRALRHIRRHDGRPAGRSRGSCLVQPGARDRHRRP